MRACRGLCEGVRCVVLTVLCSALQVELDMYDSQLRASPAAIVATKVDAGGDELSEKLARLRSSTMLPVLEVR